MRGLVHRGVLARCLLAIVAIVGSVVIFLITLDSVIMPYIVDVERVRVPQIIGQKVSEAAHRLRRRGLRLEVLDTVYDENVEAGRIVDQTPKPGRFMKKARRVFVDTSRGRRFYTVPDVRERSLREAQLQLRGSQLQVGKFSYVSSGSIPEGAVISQIPVAGTRLPRGGAVDLKVSSGSPFARKRVPDLLNLSIEVVEDSLRKYEMELGSIREQLDNTRPPGSVLEQSPSADDRVMRYTPVEIVISVRTDATIRSDTTDTIRREVPR